MVQVYGARAVGAKGLFGVHTWVAVKPTEAQEWTVYEVVGWRLRWSPSAVVIHSRPPDARWFGAAPELYAERRGPGVDELIERIDKAARAYPYGAEYQAWPGPNSNTFTAWIARAVPELELDLPATAIGKDYLGSSIFGAAPSGSGVQLSLGGVFGLAVSAVDGLEFNVLGLNFGISPNGLKLPMVGRVGINSGSSNGVEPSRSNSRCRANHASTSACRLTSRTEGQVTGAEFAESVVMPRPRAKLHLLKLIAGQQSVANAIGR